MHPNRLRPGRCKGGNSTAGTPDRKLAKSGVSLTTTSFDDRGTTAKEGIGIPPVLSCDGRIPFSVVRRAGNLFACQQRT